MTTELITAPENAALRDLRSQAMLAPVEVIKAGMAEYVERRKAFRDGLKSQLKEGVHYGYPPGCEPKIRESDGWIGVWFKGKAGERGEMRYYPPEQWQAKPSLYKAGADFLCDFLNLVAVFDADEVAWKQLGSPSGTFVFRCRLYPQGQQQTPETLKGEGRGIRRTGQKGGDDNNALKMAQKSAKVDAVLNGLGLADLFTQQDPDDAPPGPVEHASPAQREAPVIVQPRGERVETGDLRSLVDAWIFMRQSQRLEAQPAQYAAWVAELTGMNLADVRKADCWNLRDFARCRDAILGERHE